MGATARGNQMICIVSVLVALSIIAVILRAFARLKRRVSFGVDDYLCFVSILLLIGMLIELILCTSIYQVFCQPKPMQDADFLI
jgi:hypothetical protein